MKIKKLAVKNFRSLKTISIKNFLDVNMIYGYNNSGKSNLFKFLEMIFSTTNSYEDVKVEGPGTVNEVRSVKENFWEKTILNQPFIFWRETGKPLDIEYEIELELSIAMLKKKLEKFKIFKTHLFPSELTHVNLLLKGKIEPLGNYNAHQSLLEANIGDNLVFNLDETNSGEYFKNIEALDFRDFESFVSLCNDCILFLDNDRYFIKEIEGASNEELTAKNFKNKIFELSLDHNRQKDFQELNTFLKKFVSSSTDAVFVNNEKSSPFKRFNFEFFRLKGEIEIMLINDFGKFPLNSFGTGVQQIIFILSKIFLADKKIVLIEEIELNLSPKYQLELISFLFKIIGSSIDQLFYTTHSPLMCYRTEFRSLQARIDAQGISTILSIAPLQDDIRKFKAAMKILEHYHPNVATADGLMVVKENAKKAVAKKATKKKLVRAVKGKRS